MLPLKPKDSGDHVRDLTQFQSSNHPGQHKIHLLQPPALRLQPHPLLQELGQRPRGILAQQAAADFLQGRSGPPEDGDGEEVVELLRVVIEIAVVPLAGRGQQADVLVVPQGLLGGTAQGGEGAGGHPSPIPFHKHFLQN